MPNLKDTAPDTLDPETIYVFTDGSLRVDKESGIACGGWAAVLVCGDKLKETLGGETNTTVNRMELMAIREAMKLIRPGAMPVKVYSDSQYAVNSVIAWGPFHRLRGWVNGGGEPVPNADILEDILALYGERFSLGWVKGHSRHAYNDRADTLSKEGRAMAEKLLQKTYIPDLSPEELDALIYEPELAKAIQASRAKSQEMIAAGLAPKPRLRVRTRPVQ